VLAATKSAPSDLDAARIGSSCATFGAFVYQPSQFREVRQEAMHELMRTHAFATLVVLEGGALSANHLPIVIHPELSEKGVLRGHVAKANEIWRRFDQSLEALAIFQGPNHYVSPSWYPSKAEHGRVVPTWNYVVVHAYGPLKFIDDERWLKQHLDELTSRHEDGRSSPWRVSDAPDDFVARLLEGIVGFEMPISRLEGKWKLSQNRSEPDRRGVQYGLATEHDRLADEISKLVE
jgi:transcriptional regulator